MTPGDITRDMRKIRLHEQPDEISPAGVAEIRKLLRFPAGELTHVRVPAGKVSLVSRVHPSSEWFVVTSGGGQIWDGAANQILDLKPDRSFWITPATPFQYRSTTNGDLEYVLAVIPPWRPEFHGVLSDGSDHMGKWPASAKLPKHLDDRGELEAAVRPGITCFDPDSRDRRRHRKAPNGSLIWTMGAEDRGGLCLCSLPPGGISTPVFHPALEEIWYVLSGGGQLSRRHGTGHPVEVDLSPGTCADIARGITFQFRAGHGGLRMLLLTMPRWPGDHAATPDPKNARWPTG